MSILGAVATLIVTSVGNNPSFDKTSISGLWALGFGTVTEQSLLHLSLAGASGSVYSSLIPTVLIANLPQLVLTFLYFTYNGLFTCMLIAKEWNDYAYKRIPLRVTAPRGQQRSSYRLQLPYRYAIPLMIMSGLLHWLTSQSLFLARITFYNENGSADENQSASTCGYSPIAIIVFLIACGVALLSVIAMSFRKYKPGMPLARSCSAAISAACHRPETDEHASTKPVMWGVVSHEFDEDLGKTLGHCCFTSLEVKPPVEGSLYGNRGSKEHYDLGTSRIWFTKGSGTQEEEVQIRVAELRRALYML